MTYDRIIAIEFNHCDPPGIVFYPRYFEMTNSVVENFFAEVLHYSYSRITMEEGRGVPTARIECNFHAPSRLGERVLFRLSVGRVGGASVTFRVQAQAGGEARLTADLTLVWVNASGRPEPWPEIIRRRLTDFQTGETA